MKIGSVSAPIYNPGEKIKVPDVLFYENPQVITQANRTCDVCRLSFDSCKPKDDNSATASKPTTHEVNDIHNSMRFKRKTPALGSNTDC